jgi:Tol biopolymer transport system component
LNHPNVCTLYDVGPNYLVMELVEGLTLADRILQGPIAIQETLNIGRQIADALEAAHEKGIVHRDLKPSNIKIKPDGTVKVLDFGLAKTGSRATASPQDSPTISITPTEAGVILGTAAYMSPEQARGKTVDKRSDIWAFGCVVFEMLTGTRTFDGDGTSEILASVLRTDPPWSRLPEPTPPAVRRLLRRCLEKDVRRRLADVADARIEIDDAQHETGAGLIVEPSVSRAARPRLYVALAVTTLVAIGALVWAMRPAVAPPEMRFDVVIPPATDPRGFALSPDGRQLVYMAKFEGGTRLWLRSMESGSAQPLPGTENHVSISLGVPFWSPDSRSIGFFADGKIKRIDIQGFAVQTLADALGGGTAAWSRDGAIVFNPNEFGAVFQVSETGGKITQLTAINPGQGGLMPIQFLPDGRHFLLTSLENPRSVYVAQLDGSEPQRLVDSPAASYLPSGQLLYIRQGVLYAQDFDPVKLSLTGTPVTLASGDVAWVSSSLSGTVAYRTGNLPQAKSGQLVWFDRTGTQVGKAGPLIPAAIDVGNPSLSLDGNHLALQRGGSTDPNIDVWVLDIVRGFFDRFTSDSSIEAMPIWSPDGRRIVFNFANTPNGGSDIYEKPVGSAGLARELLKSPEPKFPCDWSRDGRFVLYKASKTLSPPTLSPTIITGDADLWVLPLDGDRKPFPVAQERFDERDGQFSPDVKWIAYESDESGRYEIYVQPFPGSGGKHRVSTDGGTQVRWRADGTELFYIAQDGRSCPRQSSTAQTAISSLAFPFLSSRRR